MELTALSLLITKHLTSALKRDKALCALPLSMALCTQGEFVEVDMILVTVVASLLSGLFGVLVSFKFYERLEKRKLKIETAIKLIGGRYDMGSYAFNTALNQIFVVYADSNEVMKAMEELWVVLQTPIQNQPPNEEANDKLKRLLKEICSDSGITHPKHFNDAFFLRTLSVPKQVQGTGT